MTTRSTELPTLEVGMLLYPGFTQLDLTGPYEVFCRMPGAKVSLLAETRAPVRSEWGMMFTPDETFAGCEQQDILCVPGGWGVNQQLENAEMLAFLRSHESHARYITSVCSGALILGAAGLLRGYRATTHWMSLDMLSLFGSEPIDERVVIDRNRITGGGVTAGIDFGLVVAAELFGPMVAQEIQLAIEYQPSPPFQSGLPATAPSSVREVVLARSERALTERRGIIERITTNVR
jgi:cyclohexyl-isocyanide hydratase